MLAGAHPAPKDEEVEKTFGGTRPGREDIMKVKGIKQGIYNKIKDRITVQ